MKRKPIRNVVLLGTISIIGIVITQIYWINKAWKINEKQFNHSINIALRNVAHELYIQRGDSINAQEKITQFSPNYFLVSINDIIPPYLLENLIKNEFKSRNIDLDFEYGIYDCFTDSIIYGSYVYMKPGATKNKKAKSLLPKEKNKDGHYFGIYFPTRETYLLSQMGIWIFSSLILFLVVAFFAYAMSVILRQKRVSEITTDFINNMTHEFKTPISTISLSSEVLMKSETINNPDRIYRYSNIIFDENNRLKNMVERLLQMATLDRADFSLDKVDHDVHEIINQCVNRFLLVINEKNGNIRCELNAIDKIIKADKIHVTNIISNLIDNAIKYSLESPDITITTRNVRKGIAIKVKDNGIGMSTESQKQVFNKFYRVSTGNIHDVKGFGLGLNYVKIMIEAHKGKIKLESQLGKGSTFEIFLPQ